MVRAKTNRKIGTTSKEAMARAVKLVLEENHSLREAGNICGIKFQTLARYVKKSRNGPDRNIIMEPNYANRQVFTEEDEKMLAEYIITCSRMAYGLTTDGVKKLAYQFATTNNRSVPESWKTNKRAGSEWLRSFRKRRGNLSIRQPEQCSLSRLTSFNEFNVNQFYSNLRNILEKNDKLKDPSRIFKLDETSTTTVQKPKKVVAEKGVKQISHCTSGERGTLVTTCAIVSASGNHIPPAMIFPRKNFKARMLRGAPPGTLGLANPSGWMSVELFMEVLNHFIKQSKSSKDNPSILIYDNHESHISIGVVNMARDNGVTILTLPPHSSNKIQPLDLSVFGPFKAYYYTAIDSWLLQNPGIPITIYEIAECVGVAHAKAFTPANIMAGFKKAGIWPFDDTIFTEVDFLTSAVTDRPLLQNEEQPIASSSEDRRLNQEEQPLASSTSTDISACNVAEPKVREHEKLPPRTPPPKENKLNIRLQNQDIVRPKTITPESIRGYPKAAPRKANRKPRNKGRSTIITDTPEKTALEEKAQKAEQHQICKITKQLRMEIGTNSSENVKIYKNKSTKRKISNIEQNDSSTDSSSDDYDLVNDESSDDDGWIPEDEFQPDYLKTGQMNDFALVKFPNKVFYIGKLLSDKDDEGDYDISYMRKSEKLGGCFVFPVVPDVHSVNVRDIEFILPEPIRINSKRMSANLVKFSISFHRYNVR